MADDSELGDSSVCRVRILNITQKAVPVLGEQTTGLLMKDLKHCKIISLALYLCLLTSVINCQAKQH